MGIRLWRLLPVPIPIPVPLPSATSATTYYQCEYSRYQFAPVTDDHLATLFNDYYLDSAHHQLEFPLHHCQLEHL